MTPKYGRFELSLQGPSAGNPFLEVHLEATFQQGNTRCRVLGFYDGDGIYRIRFMPELEGEWTYVTRSNVPELDGKTGIVEVGPADAGCHGPVRVAKKYHFAHADGTPFIPVGTTAYNWVNQTPEIVAQTWKTLAENPFNKIRMGPFPKHYLYNLNEPMMYPFEGGIKSGMEATIETIPPFMAGTSDNSAYEFNCDVPNVKFWQYFDTVLDRMQTMGIECDFILFHPYDRWGFSHMTQEQNRNYTRYMMARYASYANVWWSLANEWDLFRHWTEEDWEAIADVLKTWDYADHLRSIHNCTRFYDYGRGWITHCSMQRIDYHSHVELTSKWREQWGKPVVIDEICYEGNIDNGFGNISGEELTKRFWDVTIRGGYCTHGETYMRDDEVLWWAKGGWLTGTSPARIAFLRQIVEDAPGYLDPGAKEWDLPWAVSGERYVKMMQTPFGNMRSESAEWMMCYFSFAQPIFRSFRLPEDHKYQIDVIDTWNMTITPVEGIHSGNTRVDLPGRPYIAVRFREVE